MAGDQPPVIEERTGSSEEVKLNFKNLFTFFSSLDYLRFLELEGAFDEIRSRELYYVGERVHLSYFVLKHVVPATNLVYWLFLLTLTLLYGVNPVVISLVIIAFYTFLGFLIVDRYTIGKGYLYSVFRDFLLNTLVFTFISYVVGDILVFYLLPKAWFLFVDWYSSVEGKVSSLIAEMIYPIVSPILNTLVSRLYPYIYVYFYTSPVKILSLVAIYLYFVYLSGRREHGVLVKIERFKKRA